MFDGKYFEWNQKRTKGIVDHYGYQFFYGKRVADLGCGYADISGALYRLGSDVTTVDARQDHLKIVTKKFQGIKVVKANLDGPWPFFGQRFDLILDLGLICHLASFEEHLKAVCASTTHLVLETAVCDSDDPSKCVQVSEGKDVYDLAYNGMGCRPTAAAIERVLTSCGMTFKRVDSSKFNVGDYVYDWQPQNDNSTSLSKRRIWFASKTTVGIISLNPGSQPAIAITPPPSTMGYTTPIQNSGIPVALTASPRPPRSTFQDPLSINRQPNMTSTIIPPERYPNGLVSNYMENSNSSINAQVTKNSREFSILTPEFYAPPTTFSTSGIIFPNTLSSRFWMKKIAPLFPNLKVSTRAFGMFDFSKTSEPYDLVMCTIGSLIPNRRIWIEEWANKKLQPGDIEILKNCQTIMTPSLINAQEILGALPDANVIRVEKPWPMLPIAPSKTDYFLYFEKDADMTQNVLNSWTNDLGKLVVVGSRISLPNFAEAVLDTVDYNYIMSLFMGAKAILDLSFNNYYMSGILKMAQSLSLPIITNNQVFLNKPNSFFVDQDIRAAILNFINEPNKSTASFNEYYNNSVNDDVVKLIGA